MTEPQEIVFQEARQQPVCPYCEEEIREMEYTCQKLSFGFMAGFAWVIVLQCPHCAKILGTQSRG